MEISRKTSLDELPQIFNIFIGDMSVIGPRPALWNQDDLIAERDEYNINNLTPGLTGWAQINGRDELPIPEKVQMDKVYYDNLSFARSSGIRSPAFPSQRRNAPLQSQWQQGWRGRNPACSSVDLRSH